MIEWLSRQWGRLRRGEPLTRRWGNYWCGENTVHTVPRADTLPHYLDEDGECPCGTRTEPVQRDDGSIGWLIVHRSWDGREQFE